MKNGQFTVLIKKKNRQNWCQRLTASIMLSLENLINYVQFWLIFSCHILLSQKKSDFMLNSIKNVLKILAIFNCSLTTHFTILKFSKEQFSIEIFCCEMNQYCDVISGVCQNSANVWPAFIKHKFDLDTIIVATKSFDLLNLCWRLVLAKCPLK